MEAASSADWALASGTALFGSRRASRCWHWARVSALVARTGSSDSSVTISLIMAMAECVLISLGQRLNDERSGEGENGKWAAIGSRTNMCSAGWADCLSLSPFDIHSIHSRLPPLLFLLPLLHSLNNFRTGHILLLPLYIFVFLPDYRDLPRLSDLPGPSSTISFSQQQGLPPDHIIDGRMLLK